MNKLSLVVRGNNVVDRTNGAVLFTSAICAERAAFFIKNAYTPEQIAGARPTAAVTRSTVAIWPLNPLQIAGAARRAAAEAAAAVAAPAYVPNAQWFQEAIAETDAAVVAVAVAAPATTPEYDRTNAAHWLSVLEQRPKNSNAYKAALAALTALLLVK